MAARLQGKSAARDLLVKVEEGFSMLSYYKRYKAKVAPVYRSEIDRHLFATASFRRRKSPDGESQTWREWLRAWFTTSRDDEDLPPLDEDSEEE
jgi:hypothetical protein